MLHIYFCFHKPITGCVLFIEEKLKISDLVPTLFSHFHPSLGVLGLNLVIKLVISLYLT